VDCVQVECMFIVSTFSGQRRSSRTPCGATSPARAQLMLRGESYSHTSV